MTAGPRSPRHRSKTNALRRGAFAGAARLERTASSRGSAIIFSRKIRWFRSHCREPHRAGHTPAPPPLPFHAAICLPVMMPPAASTCHVADFLDRLYPLGPSTMVETSPAICRRPRALTTQNIDAGRDLAQACSWAPTRAATVTPCFLPMSIISGRHASALGRSSDGWRNEASSTFPRQLPSERLRLDVATLSLVSSTSCCLSSRGGTAMLRRESGLQGFSK